MTYSRPAGYLDATTHEMLFKMVKADAKLVKAVFETNQFGQTEGNDWNILWSSQSHKANLYDTLYEYQKINHFPHSQELTHKAKLIANVTKMQEKIGKDQFNIIPDSYILPDEFADFYSHFHSLRSKELPNQWIIKPQNSSQGKGIYIIDDISEVPIDENCIISRYIPNPFLINGLKFDLRVYVLITSMDPWRVYIYHEGLARFAVDQYTESSGKNAKNAHLTNFSLNKKHEKFIQNQNAEQDDMGHKWSMQGLNKHLEQLGIDMNLVWSRIYDVILKSMVCFDTQVQSGLKKCSNKSGCFELLGYDILMDTDLKPWLMEVNLSPSLATDSPLDLKIKSGLFLDAMNLICVKKIDRRKDPKKQQRGKSFQKGRKPAQVNGKIVMNGDERRQKLFGTHTADDETITADMRNKQIIDKISQLNPRLREVLRETLLENSRKAGFIRIYPTKGCDMYDQYFQAPKPLHKMVYKCLFTDEIIPFPLGYPEVGVVLVKPIVDETPKKVKSMLDSRPIDARQHLTPLKSSEASDVMRIRSRDESARKKLSQKFSSSNLVRSEQKSRPAIPPLEVSKEKLLITGDDVLIEYVHRLMMAVQSLKDIMMKPQWKLQLEKFIKHYVWHTSDVRRTANNSLWQRLESRLIEMKERRKRLQQSIYLRERGSAELPLLPDQDYQSDFLKVYEAKEAQKNVIIQGFSAQQLEEMLRTSTRNVAYEVISCLIDDKGHGLLTEIIKFLTTVNKNFVLETSGGSSFLDGIQRKRQHYGKHHNINDFNQYSQQFRVESEEETEGYADHSKPHYFRQKNSSLSVGSQNHDKRSALARKQSLEQSTQPASHASQIHKPTLKQIVRQRVNQDARRPITKTALTKDDIIFQNEITASARKAMSPDSTHALNFGLTEAMVPSTADAKRISEPRTALKMRISDFNERRTGDSQLDLRGSNVSKVKNNSSSQVGDFMPNGSPRTALDELGDDKWRGDKRSNTISQVSAQNLTVHNWSSKKSPLKNMQRNIQINANMSGPNIVLTRNMRVTGGDSVQNKTKK